MATAGSKPGASGAGPEAVEAFAARQAGGGVELGDRNVEGDGEHRAAFRPRCACGSGAAAIFRRDGRCANCRSSACG